MRALFLSLLFVLALSVHADDYVVVEQTSGEKSWDISSVKNISFEEDSIKFTFNDEATISYAKATFKMLKFNTTPLSINDIDDNENKITLIGNTLFIDNENALIKVYSVSGVLVAQGKGPKLDISNLSDGVYVIQSDTIIAKIVKK